MLFCSYNRHGSRLHFSLEYHGLRLSERRVRWRTVQGNQPQLYQRTAVCRDNFLYVRGNADAPAAIRVFSNVWIGRLLQPSIMQLYHRWQPLSDSLLSVKSMWWFGESLDATPQNLIFQQESSVLNCTKVLIFLWNALKQFMKNNVHRTDVLMHAQMGGQPENYA